MGDLRSADPEHLECLADLLDGLSGERGVAEKLHSAFNEAARLDVSDSLAPLQPLMTWAVDVADQLRGAAAILRGDVDAPSWNDIAEYVPDPRGFSDGAYVLKAVGQDLAEEFAALAEKDRLTHEELRWMNQILMDHGEEPAFAGCLVDEIGLEDYLRFSERLDETAALNPEEATMVTMLQSSMGTALASAFYVPGDMEPGSAEYEDWVISTPQGRRYEARFEVFKTIGMQKFGVDRATSSSTAPMTGFDLALDLLEESNVPVDDQFFLQTTNHLIELESDNPEIWSTYRYEGDDYPEWNPKNDAVDRMLALGAQNPDAVEAFFDPDRTDRLDYFLGDGDGSRDIEPSLSSRGGSPGLAVALEVASTGIVPGTESPPQAGHSPASLRIAENVWNTFAEDRSRVSEGADFEFLRPTLGVIASDHIASMQPVAQQLSTSEMPKFQQVGTGLLIAELAKDQEIYELILTANTAYTDVRIEEAIASNVGNRAEMEKDVGRAAQQGGYLTGLLTDARATAVYEAALEGDASRNGTVDRTQEYTDIVVNEFIARIPVAGGLAGEGASRVSNAVFGIFQADSEDQAGEALLDDYEESRAATIRGSRETAWSIAQQHFSGLNEHDFKNGVETSAGDGFDGGTDRVASPEEER